MKTIQLNLYPFAELNKEAGEKALNDHRYTNVQHTWWDGIYDDAQTAGLNITGFEFEQGYYCNAQFTKDALYCAEQVFINHGESTETYQTALAFKTERDEILKHWPKGDEGEIIGEIYLEVDIETCEEQFLTGMKWAYHRLLISEYNHLTSDVALVETFEANNYHFTADGSGASFIEQLAANEPIIKA